LLALAAIAVAVVAYLLVQQSTDDTPPDVVPIGNTLPGQLQTDLKQLVAEEAG
ncbi:MAG: hypothetical protein JWL64_1051, partial [Frankiales bacterium]|nr:hypothetical protein [Frankiales bacterium]